MFEAGVVRFIPLFVLHYWKHFIFSCRFVVADELHGGIFKEVHIVYRVQSVFVPCRVFIGTIGDQCGAIYWCDSFWALSMFWSSRSLNRRWVSIALSEGSACPGVSFDLWSTFLHSKAWTALSLHKKTFQLISDQFIHHMFCSSSQFIAFGLWVFAISTYDFWTLFITYISLFITQFVAALSHFIYQKTKGRNRERKRGVKETINKIPFKHLWPIHTYRVHCGVCTSCI